MVGKKSSFLSNILILIHRFFVYQLQIPDTPREGNEREYKRYTCKGWGIKTPDLLSKNEQKYH